MWSCFRASKTIDSYLPSPHIGNGEAKSTAKMQMYFEQTQKPMQSPLRKFSVVLSHGTVFPNYFA
jgi:hypothetical protein